MATFDREPQSSAFQPAFDHSDKALPKEVLQEVTAIYAYCERVGLEFPSLMCIRGNSTGIMYAIQEIEQSAFDVPIVKKV